MLSYGQEKSWIEHSIYTDSTSIPTTSILEDKRGFLWMATAGEGLIQYDGFEFNKYNKKEGLKDPFITSMLEDNYGNIWLGTNNKGITKFNGKKFSGISMKEDLVSNQVTCMAIDNKEMIWVGTNKGISVIHENKVKLNFTDANGLISNQINCLFRDSNGHIWVGTEKGINIYQQNTFTTIGRDEGLPYQKIHFISQDNDKNIWIGAKGNGLLKLNAKSISKGGLDFEQIGSNQGLRKTNVNFIYQLKNQNILIGTKKNGILTLENDSLIRNGNIKDVNIKSICVDRFKNMWIGTEKGILQHKAENSQFTPPILHLTEVKIFSNDTEIKPHSKNMNPWFKLPNSISVPFDQNNISFQYRGITFNNPKDIHYQYILKGFDVKWQPSTQEKEVTYKSLPPGEYTFGVNAFDINGQWTAEPVYYHFIINPPFWKSWDALMLLLPLLGFTFYYIKKRQTKRNRPSLVISN